MRRIKSQVCALAAVAMVTVSMPAVSLAAPVHVPRLDISASGPIEQVKSKYKYNGYKGGYKYGYKNQKYHGNRYYKSYNYNYNYLVPGAAFLGGAIVGGMLAAPRYAGPPRYYAAPRYYNGGNTHVRWCYNRYKSYREWDNTFQPYHGPRKQCRPY